MNENFLYNNPKYKELRRSLRKKSTKTEEILWKNLKGKKLKGLKFRRQYGVGRYIIDFYCPEVRLAIELDGSYHLIQEVQEYDRERKGYLQSFDINVLGFTNDRIYSHLEEVLREIEIKCKTLKKFPPK